MPRRTRQPEKNSASPAAARREHLGRSTSPASTEFRERDLWLETTLRALHEDVRRIVESTPPQFHNPTLSVAEAAQVLGCRRRKVFYLLKEGALVGTPKIGRERRITRDSVEELLAASEQPRRHRKRALDDVARLEDIPVFER